MLLGGQNLKVKQDPINNGAFQMDNPKLEGTSLKNDDYLAFNFNDYPSGMVF